MRSVNTTDLNIFIINFSYLNMTLTLLLWLMATTFNGEQVKSTTVFRSGCVKTNYAQCKNPIADKASAFQ